MFKKIRYDCRLFSISYFYHSGFLWRHTVAAIVSKQKFFCVEQLSNRIASWNPRWRSPGNIQGKIGDNQILFCPTQKYLFPRFPTKFEIRSCFQQFNVDLFQDWRFPSNGPSRRKTHILVKVCWYKTVVSKFHSHSKLHTSDGYRSSYLVRQPVNQNQWGLRRAVWITAAISNPNNNLYAFPNIWSIILSGGFYNPVMILREKLFYFYELERREVVDAVFEGQ